MGRVAYSVYFVFFFGNFSFEYGDSFSIDVFSPVDVFYSNYGVDDSFVVEDMLVVLNINPDNFTSWVMISIRSFIFTLTKT